MMARDSLTRRQFILGTASLSAGVAYAGDSAGELVFVGWQGEDDPQAAAEFTTAAKVRIRSSYVASGDELLTRLRMGGAGSIDVVSQNKDYIPLSIRAGFLEPLDLHKIPNAAGLFPVLATAPWVQSGGHTYAVPLAWGDSPLVWDPRKWEGPPSTYAELASAKYKGALTCLDDAYSVLWLFSSSLGHPDPARITQAQLDETVKLARAVRKNIVLIGSFGDATDVIVRGDASMAFSGWEMMVNIAARKGVVLKSGLTTKDRGFLWADAYSIPKGARNIEQAHAFINHMLSPRSNAMLASRLGSAGVSEAALKLMQPSSSGGYNYEMVRGAGARLMHLSVLPPLAPEGDVVGIAAWRKAWQEFKA
jgi:spermidine/putrescine-binding protein